MLVDVRSARYLFAAFLIHLVRGAIHPDKSSRQLKLPKTPRIIGGYNATQGRFPYYTLLKKDETYSINCGGSLIAPDVVLTAAHCYGYTNVAEVGRYNLDDPTDDFESFQGKKSLTHPFFGVQADYSSDFMLVFLDRSSSATPVKINRDGNVPKPGQDITVIGLGVSSTTFNLFPTILQGVNLNVIPNDECERTTDGRRTYHGLITQTSLCAWRSEKASCQGDSGGPYFVEGTSADQDVQVGIVSWAYGCVDPIFPDVPARVSAGADWIVTNVCLYSKDPPSYFDCQNAKPEPYVPTNPVLPGKTFPITVEIELGYNPVDTWWFILNSTQELIYIVPRYTYGLNSTFKNVTQVLHLPVGQTYTFVTKDGEVDGISYDVGYVIRLGTGRDGLILLDSSLFSSTSDYRSNFTLPRSITPQPTVSPTISKGPTVSPAPTLPVLAVTLIINFPNEYYSSYFGYEFLNSAGVVVNSAPIGTIGYNNLTIEETIHLQKGESYTFVLMSEYTYLYPGNFSLILGSPDAGGPMLTTGDPTFRNTTSGILEERFRFTLPNSFSAVPSISPSVSPTLMPTVSPRPTGPLQTITITIDFGPHSPSYFGYLLLDARNKTIVNVTYETFFTETVEEIYRVSSEQQVTFILLNEEGIYLHPGNYSIALGLPGERGPVLAGVGLVSSDGNTTDTNDDAFSTDTEVVANATFYIPLTYSAAPSMAPTYSSPVTLFIDFAGYPSEVGYSFFNAFGDYIVDVPIGTFGFANKTIQQVINLPSGQEYTFAIEDYFGDGRFPGRFSLVLGTPGAGGKTIVSKTGIDGYREEYSFVASGTSPPSTPFPTFSPTVFNCSICGEGQNITLPDAEVYIGGAGTYTCGEVQGYLDEGLVLQKFCAELPAFAEVCGCSGGGGSSSPSTFPTPTPSRGSLTPPPVRTPAPSGGIIETNSDAPTSMPHHRVPTIKPTGVTSKTNKNGKTKLPTIKSTKRPTKVTTKRPTKTTTKGPTKATTKGPTKTKATRTTNAPKRTKVPTAGRGTKKPTIVVNGKQRGNVTSGEKKGGRKPSN